MHNRRTVVRTYRIRNVTELVSAEAEVYMIDSNDDSRQMLTASVLLLIEMAVVTLKYVTLEGLS
jgi:hypothetical protein